MTETYAAVDLGSNSFHLVVARVVDGFEVPVVVIVNGESRRVTIGPEPVKLAFDGAFEGFELDRNFYMSTERLGG